MGAVEWIALPLQIACFELAIYADSAEHAATAAALTPIQSGLQELLNEVLDDLGLADPLQVGIYPVDKSLLSVSHAPAQDLNLKLAAATTLLQTLRELAPGSSRILTDQYIVRKALQTVEPATKRPFYRHRCLAALTGCPALAPTRPNEDALLLPERNLPLDCILVSGAEQPPTAGDHGNPASTIRMVRSSRSVAQLIDGLPGAVRSIFENAANRSALESATPGFHPLRSNLAQLGDLHLLPTDTAGLLVLEQLSDEQREALDDVLLQWAHAHSTSACYLSAKHPWLFT
jgi:hypothetical protein